MIHIPKDYEVYRKQGLGRFEKVAVLDLAATSYKDTNVKTDMMYTYKIAAIVDGQTSFYSLPVVIEPNTATAQ